MAVTDKPMWAGRVGSLAGFRRSSRIDAGTTKTLDALRKKGLVVGRYESSELFGLDTSRRWAITDEGRRALGTYAFGEL